MEDFDPNRTYGFIPSPVVARSFSGCPTRASVARVEPLERRAQRVRDSLARVTVSAVLFNERLLTASGFTADTERGRDWEHKDVTFHMRTCTGEIMLGFCEEDLENY